MSALATALYRGRQQVAALDAADRGLAYGDGLFETLLVHEHRATWWPAHWARLARGARALRIPVPNRHWLEAELGVLLPAAPPRAVLKIILSRGVGGRGYVSDARAEPTLALSVHEAPPPLPAAISVRWCQTRMAIQPALAGLKHLNRLEQVLARAEWRDSRIHEGLMLDTDGRVACATAANVFALVRGRWLTPPVDRRGVAGVARAWVLAHEPRAVEAELTPAQVESAEAVFLCNAVRGILPVGSLGARRWPLHPALQDLQRRLGRSKPAFKPGS
ncbi:aminodeoxychorismate lyase [Arenimonas sp. MALMAid1274]|uniref:aminodeoxychorismate lyase n=1 Tax=Arenimonas sp. MALMAid1274 TaxID=3411630 RepID=UPI003BA0E639